MGPGPGDWVLQAGEPRGGDRCGGAPGDASQSQSQDAVEERRGGRGLRLERSLGCALSCVEMLVSVVVSCVVSPLVEGGTIQKFD